MKIRGSILGLVAIAAVLIALVLWYGKKQPVEAPPTASVETNVAPPAATAPGQPVSAPLPPNAPATQVAAGGAPAATSQSASPQPQDKIELLKEILQANDADIAFYGLLEDQFGNLLGNVPINFEIRYENTSGKGVQRGQIKSDANGSFTISGYKGERLSFIPEKSGYVLISGNNGGIYSPQWPEAQRIHPDKNNPVIVKMWKLQGAGPLTGINKTFKLPYTGEPIFFDLVTGNMVPAGGDLEAIVTRAPGVISGRNHGDWSIKFVPVNGGIMETDYHTSLVTFEAPADGYQESYFVQMSHDDPAWFDNIQKVFFLMSRNGQVYSKLSVAFGINDEPDGTMWFQIKGVSSANGSRNWEASVPQ